MSLIGDSPEKRRYNLSIIAVGIATLPTLLGFLLKSEFLILAGSGITLAAGVFYAKYKTAYYLYDFRKFKKNTGARIVTFVPVLLVVTGCLSVLLGWLLTVLPLLAGGIVVLGYSICSMIFRIFKK